MNPVLGGLLRNNIPKKPALKLQILSFAAHFMDKVALEDLWEQLWTAINTSFSSLHWPVWCLSSVQRCINCPMGTFYGFNCKMLEAKCLFNISQPLSWVSASWSHDIHCNISLKLIFITVWSNLIKTLEWHRWNLSEQNTFEGAQW